MTDPTPGGLYATLALADEAGRLRAEVEELRAALRNMLVLAECWHEVAAFSSARSRMMAAARAALAAPAPPGAGS